MRTFCRDSPPSPGAGQQGVGVGSAVQCSSGFVGQGGAGQQGVCVWAVRCGAATVCWAVRGWVAECVCGQCGNAVQCGIVGQGWAGQRAAGCVCGHCGAVQRRVCWAGRGWVAAGLLGRAGQYRAGATCPVMEPLCRMLVAAIYVPVTEPFEFEPKFAFCSSRKELTGNTYSIAIRAFCRDFPSHPVLQSTCGWKLAWSKCHLAHSRKPQQPSPSNFFRVSVERPTPRSKRSGGMRGSRLRFGSSGVFCTALILTTDLNNLAYKTRCDSTVADAALRVGDESRRSFARWVVFLMLLSFFNVFSFFS